MKINCACGTTIYDQSDALSYKAHLLADQDLEDVHDQVTRAVEQLAVDLQHQARDDTSAAAVDRAIQDIVTSLGSATQRSMYQCTGCDRLFVDDTAGALHIFRPTGNEGASRLLRSMHGDQWKRPLRGSWHPWRSDAEKGELWWGFGGEDEGFERFDSVASLRQRYHSTFARLRDKSILRNAMLTIDGHIEHQWP